VAVWGVPEVRGDIDAVRDLRLDTPSGASVPLRDVADVPIVPMPNVINHENGSRRIDVSCNVAGRDLRSAAQEIERRMRAIPFERGHPPEFFGEYAAR